IAWRAHRGNPARGPRLFGKRTRRDQGFGRNHGAGKAQSRGSCGVKQMRIVVHGQQAFGKAVLEALIKRGENVVAAYVAPEKPGQKADPLKEAAVAASLPVYQPASYRKPEVWAEFKDLKPDLQVMAFVTLFVPEQFLNVPTKGSIQYHPSLLPKYRGPSAINWPIIQGESETGLSIFWPDNGLDTGDVLLQKKTHIGPDDTLGSV